jgi:hypothetical protein
MKQTVNIPVQLISSCSTLGEFTPLRFRYTFPETHELITVDIQEILSKKENIFIGLHEILYTCSATIQGIEKIFTLRYSILAHQWSIFQMLS